MAYTLLIEGACAARLVRRSGRWPGKGRPGAAVFAALLALAAAGCFTGPINHPPEITVGGPPTPPRKQPEPEPYTANASDPDGDHPKVSWYVAHSPCTDANDRANWPPTTDWIASTPPDKLMIDGSDIDAPFCVWAFATDSRGAVRAGNFSVEPQDQAPTANIRVVAPNPSPNSTLYPLYSTIELSPDGSSDPEGDDLQWMWTLQAPPGSAAMRMDCNAGHMCFTADVRGDYQVTLVAMDPLGKTGTITRTISVNADQPPCIESESTMPSDQLLTPIQYDSKTNTPNQISVGAVLDDGDPYPSPVLVPMLHFHWYISKNGEPFLPVGNDFNFLPLDSNQAPGSLVKVRLEVMDRNPATATALFGCAADKDFCAAVAGCFQRVSWSIEYR